MEIKLKRAIFITFGVTFALIVAIIVVWKLKFYDDVTTQLNTANTAYQTSKGVADTLPKELLTEAVAKENLVLAKDQLHYLRVRFRSLDFKMKTPGAIEHTWRGYMQEYFADYGVEMRRELIQAANESGVIIQSAIKVDAPPPMPENLVPPANGFLKPVSGGSMGIVITGPLSNISSFLERINRSPILMIVGNIRVEGAAPTTKATFTITPYLVGTGDVSLPAAAPPADTTTAGAATPGATPAATP